MPAQLACRPRRAGPSCRGLQACRLLPHAASTPTPSPRQHAQVNLLPAQEVSQDAKEHLPHQCARQGSALEPQVV